MPGTLPPRPLDGIAVVDLTSSVAGPCCTQLLAALGADVVKVEHPVRGDDTRGWGPPFVSGESAMFLAFNAGKRSLAVDLKAPAGREAVLRVAERADVVVQNLRPGLVERLGLGAQDVQERNPALVYCTIGAFGKVGPKRHLPGYDPLMQAAGGIMSVTGEPGRPPARAGVSIVDQGAGLWAVVGILAALRERDRDGRGRVVDTSLYETALNWLPSQLVGHLGTGDVPRPQGSGLPMIAPYEAFAARDRWLMVAAGNDRQFAGLAAALELPGLAADPRFRANPDRVAHREELAAILAERLAGDDADAWLERLEREGVPAAPVQDVAEVAADEQTRALGILQPIEHPAVPGLRVVAPPLQLDDQRLVLPGAPPALGEHTTQVLAEAGYGDDEIERLRDEGVVAVGPHPHQEVQRT